MSTEASPSSPEHSTTVTNIRAGVVVVPKGAVFGCHTINGAPKQLKTLLRVLSLSPQCRQMAFTISHAGVNYEFEAKAVFLAQQVAPIELGHYHFSISSKGKDIAPVCCPDKTYYTREKAREAAEWSFSSGQVEQYVKNQIQSWIHAGSL
jgi:hypothetical protein